MDIVERFEDFSNKILPTENQKNDARNKATRVCKALSNHYYGTESIDGKYYLFGSFGKNTSVRPPRDVDILFLMPFTVYQRFNAYRENGQSAMLQEVKTILGNSFATSEKPKGWGKVVCVQFENGHNVEVLPAWMGRDGSFVIANTEQGGSWELFDPIQNVRNFAEADTNHDGLLSKLVRFAKKWTETCQVNIKSYELEKFATDFIRNRGAQGRSIDAVVMDYFDYMVSNVSQEKRSPFQTAKSRMEKAQFLALKGHFRKATEEWKKVFGNDFPLSKIEDLEAKYPAPNEKFLSQFGIPIKEDSVYFVRIDANVDQDGYRINTLSGFIHNRYPLLIKKRLEFGIVSTNVPEPYSVYWKVRNFGESAMKKNDLRGEIVPDEGRRKKVEHTKYKGEHYVECYIVKDGSCVARAAAFVPISGS
jgi:hypothetical protein